MQKQQPVVRQVLDRHANDVPSASKPRVSVPDTPLGLQGVLAKPLICERKVRAAVIVLRIVDADRAAMLRHGAEPGHAVRDVRDDLCQVQHRIGIVTHSEQKHATVQVVHPPDRTVGPVRRNGQCATGDSGGLRTDGGERKRM